MRTVRSADGTTIAYEVTGAGDPILLVGGAFNDRNSPAAGLPLAQLLAPHLEVVTFDRRGRGDSGDGPEYAVEREVEDVAAILGDLGATAMVYGHSSGAVLALKAVLAGLEVERMVLFEPPLALPPEETGSNDDLAARIGEMVAAGRRTAAVVEFLVNVVGLPEQMVAGMRQAPHWPGLVALAHTLPYELAVTGSVRLGPGEELPVHVPTLVIEGALSPAELRAAAQECSDQIPGSTLTTLEGKAHDADPESIAGAILRWLEVSA